MIAWRQVVPTCATVRNRTQTNWNRNLIVSWNTVRFGVRRQVVPNFRVRTIPVLGTTPAVFGQAAAAHIITHLAGQPFVSEPVFRWRLFWPPPAKLTIRTRTPVHDTTPAMGAPLCLRPEVTTGTSQPPTGTSQPPFVERALFAG